jgi:flagellar hook-associated protein FlgK
MADSLLVGLTALLAHQRTLEVTSHNIANATTPGYSRQSVELSTPVPESIRPGQLGRGVEVKTIQRIYDSLLTARLRQSQGDGGRLQEKIGTLEAVESIFNEPGENGIAATVNRIYAAFEDLSNNPESNAMRSAAVESLNTFATLFNETGSRLYGLREDISRDLSIDAHEINTISAEIASLNQTIRTQTLSGNNPNDLLDRRDLLLNRLGALLDVTVRINPADNTALVELGGRLLVSQGNSAAVEAGNSGTGNLALIYSDNGLAANATGGKVGAKIDLYNNILPATIDAFEALATGIMREFNQAHATGTSHNFLASEFISEFVVDSTYRDENLDSIDNQLVAGGISGIPEAFTPSFTDADGNSVARNLTINVLDNATGIAQKFIIRYEPGSGSTPASRTIDDLVSAINSGRGGGFSVEPGGAGVTGITATALSVSGGLRLALTADSGKSIDFSRALDLRPSDTAWTSGTVTVSGTATQPADFGKRIECVVQTGGTQLRVFTRDENGDEVAWGAGVIAIPNGAGTTINGILFVTGGLAADYTDGESFSIDLTSAGAVDGGPVTQTATWTQGAPAMTVRGRYTGSVAYDPDTNGQWSMRVLSTGTIGADPDAIPAGTPPIVQFTYFTTVSGSVVQKTVQKTLDDSLRAGAPVEIADGVFVTFASGILTAGDQLDFTVDAEPDQAGLLSGLGINGMFTGYNTETMAVTYRLLRDPTQLAVGFTRSAGDNANIAGIIAVRHAQAFAGGITFEEYYETTISNVGVQVEQSKRLLENQDLLIQSLQNRRDDISGVSIDEEVGALILEQQAYTAAARVVSTARENIATLMDLLG